MGIAVYPDRVGKGDYLLLQVSRALPLFDPRRLRPTSSMMPHLLHSVVIKDKVSKKRMRVGED